MGRIEDTLQGGPGQHTDGPLLNKRLKNRVEKHTDAFQFGEVTTVSIDNLNQTLEGMPL